MGLQELRQALRDGALDRIAEDQREARTLPALYPRAGLELDAVVSARGALGQRELEVLEGVLREVATLEHTFSRTIRSEIAEHRHTFKDFLRRGVWTGDEEEVFAGAADQLGIDARQVLEAERPLIRPDEYVKWLPDQHVGDYTPSELMAMAATVRRFINPDYTYRRAPDPARRYFMLADRVEALGYAAEKVMARVAAPLAAGARLLGRNLRSAELVRALGDSADPTLRRDAMSALALLGDSAAQKVGLDLLNTPGSPPDAIASVLWVLHMTGGLNIKELPRHVRSNRSWIVSSALREVILAQTHGRTLV